MDAPARARLQDAFVRLQEGDRGAFAPVYAQLWPLFLGMARRQLDADAEDVAQEALLKLFAHIDRFDADRDALSWALGIVAFEIRTARQQHSRRKEAPHIGTDAVHGGQSPEETVLARELQTAAAEVLGTLRPADVAVLERIARGEREPSATFRKRLQRALARLRVAWRSAHDLD